MNHDARLYIESANIEEQGGLLIQATENKLLHYWEILKSMLKVITSIWYLYIFLFLFYYVGIMLSGNASAVPLNIGLAIGFVTALQIFANIILLDNTIAEDEAITSLTISEKILPYKGIYKFFTVLPLVFNPVYEYISPNTNTTEVL